MKNLKSLLFIVPAVVLAALTAIGMVTNVPSIEAVVWPEEPDLSEYEVSDSSDKTELETEKLSDTKDEKTKKKKSSKKGSFEDGTYTGKGTGYGGITEVEVIVKNGSITKIDVLSNHDDAAFFNRAISLIDTIIDEQSYDVDTVSGATYSSRGILEAVKNALTGSNTLSATPTVTTPAPISTDGYDDSAVLTDGTYTGWHQGYGGLIYVSVTVKDGKMTSIDVTDHSGETDSYYNSAKSIISSMLAAGSPNVDTVSGATYSSNGIREAVKMALKSAANPDSTPEPTPEPTATPTPKPTTKPKTDGTPADGTYTGTAYCDKFNYTVSLDVTFKNGKCTNVSNFKLLNNSDSSNISYADNAWNGMKASLKSNGTADTVSGATYSSDAIQEAFNNAYNEAVAKNGGTTPTPKPTATPTPKPTATPKPEEGSYSYTGKATVESWNYEIAVTATFKDGKLTGISYDEPNTTSTNKKYMTKAWDGLSTAITSGNTEVDAVSKATLSSNAIVSAYNSALEQAKKEHSDITASSVSIKKASPTATPKPTATPNPTATPKPSEDSYSYEGTAEVKGFGYNITVKASYKNGKLSDITMTTDNYDEDNDEYISDAWNSISPSIKGGSTAVDSVSGATYSSKAIVNAYNNALEKAKKDHSDLNLDSVTINGKGQTPTPKPTATPTPSPTATPEPTATPTPTPTPEKERTYTVTSTCLWDEDLCYDDGWDSYDLTFNVTFKGNKLKDISISSSTDTSNSDYYNFAMSSVKSTLISSQSSDSVDVYCGATCSAKAILDAYNQAKAMNDAEN